MLLPKPRGCPETSLRFRRQRQKEPVQNGLSFFLGARPRLGFEKGSPGIRVLPSLPPGGWRVIPFRFRRRRADPCFSG
jgi:hypothetical protein